ncbi:copper-binding protein [Tumidithrix elongata RA019]|uniref:Copper-binding protein n=1 Tax=Tumidithrix elongata BACA0141 TaxID=2716417 RepID=A0AAW9PP36_9CYAN|nr:copper-binding protein [Tumidithrix elongata RA019]
MVSAVFTSSSFAIAAPANSNLINLVNQPAIEVKVSLSNTANELKFEPDRIPFEVGKRYKLLLSNPSAMKHYFTSKDFADAIWTQKVEAGHVEIKGNIRELELRPQATAEWFFVPIKQGSYILRCTIAGHSEAGMKGTILIQ